MNKSLLILLSLCFFCGIVSAADCWGMDYEIIDGDKHIYNATVVVVDDVYDYYHFNHVVYDANVVIGTDASVTVEGVVSPNGLPFRFSTGDIECALPHFTNKVVSGEHVPEPVVTIYDVMKAAMIEFDGVGIPESITICGIEFTYIGESQYHTYVGNGYKIELWTPLVASELLDPCYLVMIGDDVVSTGQTVDELQKFDDATQIHMLSAFNTIIISVI